MGCQNTEGEANHNTTYTTMDSLGFMNELVELRAIVTVSGFNDRYDMLTSSSLADGVVAPSSQLLECLERRPVTLVALTSVTRVDGGELPQLSVDGRDLDLALDPVSEFYPRPQTRNVTETYDPFPFERPVQGLKRGDTITRTLHTNNMYEQLKEFGPKPFISVTDLDKVKITNMEPHETVRVTGYNVFRTRDALATWVFY